MGAARVTRDRDRARAVLVLAVFMEAPAPKLKINLPVQFRMGVKNAQVLGSGQSS